MLEEPMSLKDRINADLKDAMKSGDKARVLALRSLKTAILNAEKSGKVAKELSDQEIVIVIMKEVKQRQDSIEEYKKAGREDLVAEESAEMEVLKAYLPRLMTREEIEARASEIIAEVGATGPRDMGKVMKPLMAELRGKADGSLVSQVVKELLSKK
jgi:uncharacterized protein YqeY